MQIRICKREKCQSTDGKDADTYQRRHEERSKTGRNDADTYVDTRRGPSTDF
ncbi:hypothetical protein DPMN_075843 [Dreissena polymorpha]|uniref:Uncharacterized protein n=1 Tax=Dreissena polymorpha TaxID=45954 RepID=A0A9D4BPV1_DREPO|nr:hypothetical protein DPMN_075843 [Dreissena polymorpha]